MWVVKKIIYEGFVKVSMRKLKATKEAGAVEFHAPGVSFKR